MKADQWGTIWEQTYFLDKFLWSTNVKTTYFYLMRKETKDKYHIPLFHSQYQLWLFPPPPHFISSRYTFHCSLCFHSHSPISLSLIENWAWLVNAWPVVKLCRVSQIEQKIEESIILGSLPETRARAKLHISSWFMIITTSYTFRKMIIIDFYMTILLMSEVVQLSFQNIII